MSDILIKNMEMPKGDIPLVLIITGDGTVEEIDASDEINATDAKAIELPPHGDLIERDVVYREFFDAIKTIVPSVYVNAIIARLSQVPTVLEANT